MEALRVTPLEGDYYRVSLVRGALEASCTVSSLHLVEDKRKQLERALEASCTVSSLHLVEDKRKQLERALEALEAVA
jgi:peptidase E